MTLGRNDKCWCGSGKKYKKCHLGRDKEEKSPLTEYQRILRKQNHKECLHPDAPAGCSKKIIASHTIQRSGALSAMARDGKVYTSESNLSTIKNNNVYEIKLRGTAQTSTFNGFCKTHDRDFFLDIENNGFDSSANHCFRLFYRALARCYYDKKVCLSICEEQMSILDVGKPKKEQVELQLQMKHRHVLFEKDFSDAKKEREKAAADYKSEKFNRYSSLVIKTNKIPTVMACAYIGFASDLEGNILQNLYAGTVAWETVEGKRKCKEQKVLTPLTIEDTKVAKAAINVFSSNGQGYIVISWDKANDSLFKVMSEQATSISSKELCCSIGYIVCCCIENVAFAPTWYEGLNEKQKQAIKNLLDQLDTPLDLLKALPQNRAKDEYDFGDWEVDSVVYVGQGE